MNRREGRTPSQRQLRVGEELRHALADLLRRGDFRDPELQNLNVTVTEVRISPDLRNATAFVTVLGGGDIQPALAALRRAAAFLRGQIGREVKLRHVPTIGFEGDTSFDYASHINDLLHDPAVARDLVNGDDEEEDAEYEDDLDEEDEDDDEAVEYEEGGDFDEDDEDDDPEYEDDPDEGTPPSSDPKPPSRH